MNPVSNASADVETDDSLDDFKSPIKFSRPKKINRRRNVRPYRHPGDTSCTQDILVAAYKKASEKYTNEYPSEDEFIIFKKNKQNKTAVEKQLIDNSVFSKKKKEEHASSSNSSVAKFISPNINMSMIDLINQRNEVNRCENESHITELKNTKININNSSEANFVEPGTVLNDLINPISEVNVCKNRNLRTELRNLKINEIMIEDSGESEDDVIACSQKPVRRGSLKAVNNADQLIETNSLTTENSDLQTLNAYLRIFRVLTVIFKFSFLIQSNKRMKEWFLMYLLQKCIPLKVSVKNEDTTNFSKTNNVTETTPVKTETIDQIDVPANLVNRNEYQQDSNQCVNTETPLSFQSERMVATLRKTLKTKVLKANARSMTPTTKHKPKKLRYSYVRKLWWLPNYLNRRYLASVTKQMVLEN